MEMTTTGVDAVLSIQPYLNQQSMMRITAAGTGQNDFSDQDIFFCNRLSDRFVGYVCGRHQVAHQKVN